MVHVAFKQRSDIMAHHQYKGLNICEGEAISCVPDSVFMFVRLMLQRVMTLLMDMINKFKLKFQVYRKI